MISLSLNKSFLGGVVSSSTSSPAAFDSMPCTNLFNGMRHQRCRITLAANTCTITTTLVSATSISVVAIGAFTLSLSATARCVVKNAAGDTVYDSYSGNIYGNTAQYDMNWWSRTKFWILPSSVSAKTITITITDSIPTIDISHLAFGNGVPLSINADWGVQWNWQDTVVLQRTAGGSLLANPGYGARRLQLSWSNLPTSDWNAVAGLVQSKGQSLLLSVLPGLGSRQETDLQMIGRLTSAEGINLQGYNLNSLASYVFEEV